MRKTVRQWFCILAANPDAGDLIKELGGVRKVRIARPDGGKSSGWRLLTAFVGEVAPVYLLTVYAKSQRGNVSKAEVKELARLMKELKAEIRRKRQSVPAEEQL